MMKFTCPNCQETLSLAALIEHDAAREALMLALEFPAPLGKHMLNYVSLFKPAQRNLSMDRFASLMKELLPMIQAAQITRKGTIYPAPMGYWSQAFDAVLLNRQKLTLPLKGHGYLLEVLIGFANKAESNAEKQVEQGRRYGDFHTAEAPLKVEPDKQKKAVMPDKVKETMNNLIGRKVKK
ncbi:MAG: hypothetical protein ACO1N8_06285 [Methylophilus sp.]